jgi:hypothetical protein
MAITPKSGIRVARRSIAGMEGMYTKMFDPPQESPTTPELLAPTNPVPAFMQSLGLGTVSVPNTVSLRLLAGLTLPTWDGLKNIEFMTFRDPDFGNAPSYPGPTIRIPRGSIFHCQTQASGPPPHTIHWHGMEPTPMNDGVGHCSMEIGQYTYQFQPNFSGTYFYHCHRNTVQHFEFGLYGALLIEPPDAYDPNIPIIEGGPPKNVGGYPRRVQANLTNFPQFPGFVPGDPVFGLGNASDTGVGHPHSFTVPYDVEALWVPDDRDSVWSDLAGDAKAFFPGGANTNDGPLSGAIPPVTTVRPGTDDQFTRGFFNDFNADYWYVTGVPVPAPRGGVGTINPPAAVPAILNSGVSGMQVGVNAQVNQTILVRCLNAAYNSISVRFPVDVVIIVWDGRSLGVPPFGRYNHPILVTAGTPIRMSVARRFAALIRSATPVNDFAEIQFFESRGEMVLPDDSRRLCTARIPININ